MAEDLVAVVAASDVSAARQATRSRAREIGFDVTAAEELALVAGELASNLVKHAGGGTIRTIALLRDGRAGIQIEALDDGPGIANVSTALTDGFSTSGSLGYGLGSVNRLMDELEIVSEPARRGTYVVCRRWLRATGAAADSPLDVGVATHPYPHMTVNGDSFVVKQWETGALVGIIDGVGHGQPAHEAAEAARHFVESHKEQPLDAIFRGTALACQGTRGVVMTLARFDWEREAPARARLKFAGVGNVEGRGYNQDGPLGLAVRRGLIGLNAPNPIVSEHAFGAGSLLVLHSDGLRSTWSWEQYPYLREAAMVGAPRLLRALSRGTDDATVIVIANRP